MSSAQELTLAAIREMAMAFQKSRVLLTAFELDIFTVLGKSSKTATEVAEKIGTDARATDRLLNALCALGLVKKSDRRFANTAAAASFLFKGEPEYMAGLMHTVSLWDTWSSLSQALFRDNALAEEHLERRRENWQTAFIAAMHERARKQTEEIIRLLDLSRVAKVLDVGGGSGAFAMAFVQAKSGLRAAIFDLPRVIPIAKDYIDKANLTGQIDLIAGDYLIDDLGQGYDLIFLSSIVHSNSFIENQKLIRKCGQALHSGGQIVVKDFIMAEDRTAPVHGALFALNMLVGTESGDTYTESEVTSWLRAAGFHRIRRVDTRFDSALIMGEKK